MCYTRGRPPWHLPTFTSREDRTSNGSRWHVRFVPNVKRILAQRCGLRGLDHDKLNLIGKTRSATAKWSCSWVTLGCARRFQTRPAAKSPSPGLTVVRSVPKFPWCVHWSPALCASPPDAIAASVSDPRSMPSAALRSSDRWGAKQSGSPVRSCALVRESRHSESLDRLLDGSGLAFLFIFPGWKRGTTVFEGDCLMGRISVWPSTRSKAMQAAGRQFQSEHFN